MKQCAFKVTWGKFSSFHNSLKEAKKQKKTKGGRIFEHNPFNSEAKTDEFGAWVEIDLPSGVF